MLLLSFFRINRGVNLALCSLLLGSCIPSTASPQLPTQGASLPLTETVTPSALPSAKPTPLPSSTPATVSDAILLEPTPAQSNNPTTNSNSEPFANPTPPVESPTPVNGSSGSGGNSGRSTPRPTPVPVLRTTQVAFTQAGDALDYNNAPFWLNDAWYFFSAPSEIARLNPATGNPEVVNTLNFEIASSLAADSMGNLYWGSYFGNIQSIDANQQLRWEYRPPVTGNVSFSGVALDEENHRLFVPNTANAITAVDSESGELLWKFNTRAPLFSAPVLFENKVFFMALDQTLYCLEADTGIYLWEFQTGAPIFNLHPALQPTGTVIIGSDDNLLLAIDEEGFQEWSVTLDSGLAVSPVIDENLQVYGLSKQGTVYAVDRFGELQWQRSTGSTFSTPPVVGNANVLYVALDNGQILAFSATGQVLWRYEAIQEPIASLNLDDQGRLSVFSIGGQIHILKTESTDLANSWSKVHGNRSNTGK